MKLSEHPETKYEIKIKAIDAFLSAGSLNEIASSFNIHPKTLKRWITQYKEGGKANLKRKHSLNRHRRRLPTETEIKIAHLKEKTPSLTLHKAKKILVQEGIVLSIKGIWNVWKRFGLIGYDKQIGSIEFHRYITVTSDVDSEIKRAEQLLKNGDVRGTARIVNS
ncbi:helix-turn-helix domain-containing protein, partial [candidate division WOR-3 bacterium]|nr:helix-turn-helix domain-containing protein [candidate division WOR-3 bacterium]